MTELFQDPALVLLLLFVIPLALRVPIAICLGLSASIVAWMYDMGIDMLPYNFFAGVAKFPYSAYWQFLSLFLPASSWREPVLQPASSP